MNKKDFNCITQNHKTFLFNVTGDSQYEIFAHFWDTGLRFIGDIYYNQEAGRLFIEENRFFGTYINVYDVYEENYNYEFITKLREILDEVINEIYT